MRLTKTDPTGGYSYLADGVSPASAVLSDGRTSFTPGLGETHGTGNGTYASVFYLADAQGNSRGLLDGNQGTPDGYNWDAFGNLVSRAGTNPTAYAWNEASGYQSDNDSGLKLLGHRYYDSRTGRFLSQDPAGDGDNWYAYCGNDPMNATHPTGLQQQSIDTGTSWIHGTYADLGGWSGGLYSGYNLAAMHNLFYGNEFNHIIPGFNVTKNFNEAKKFAHTPLAEFAYLKVGGNGYGTAKLLYPGIGLRTAWLIQHVKTGSHGDPKHVLVGLGNNPMYQHYDNVGQYNFGAVCAGLGLTLGYSLAGAGAAQTWQTRGDFDGFMNNLTNNGWVGAGPPYGDDPSSQYWITQGYNDYKNR